MLKSPYYRRKVNDFYHEDKTKKNTHQKTNARLLLITINVNYMLFTQTRNLYTCLYQGRQVGQTGGELPKYL